MRKAIFVTAAAAAAAFTALLGIPSKSHAFGNAPWCAVLVTGEDSVYWDCQYRTVEECVPHVIAGDRGFCNVNPYGPGPNAAPPASQRPHRKHHARH